MQTLLPLAPPTGAALALLYGAIRHGITPAEIWSTSSTAYKLVTCGCVLLSAAMLTLITPM